MLRVCRGYLTIKSGFVSTETTPLLVMFFPTNLTEATVSMRRTIGSGWMPTMRSSPVYMSRSFSSVAESMSSPWLALSA